MSLLTFNPSERGEIQTPRSKKVLCQLGLTVQDLYYPTKEEIVASGVNFEDVDFYVDVKHKHVCERVDRFLEMARQEHQQMKSSLHQNNSSTQLQLSQSFMQKQDQILRTLQNKQKIEIEREIQNELKIEEIKQKNLQKEQRIAELKKQQEEEFHQKMIEKEEKLRIREQKLKLAKQQADQENETIMKRFQEEELKIQQKQAKYALMKQEEKEQRNKDYLDKMQRRAIRLQNQQQQVQMDNLMRQQDYNKKLQVMETNLLEKQQQIKLKNLQKEEKAKEKYQIANTIKSQELAQLEQRMHSKEKDMEIRNTMQEFSRQQLLQQKRNQEQMKRYQMEQKKNYINQEIQVKNKDYFDQQQQRELRKIQQEQQKKMRRDESSMILQSHMEEVLQKQRLLEYKNEQENQKSMNFRQQQFLNAEEQRQRNIANIKKKCIIELLKLEDAAQNFSIQKRKENYKNQQLMDKFDETDRRMKNQQQEQAKLFETKKQMELQMIVEKERILADFDLKKKQFLEEKQNNSQTSQILRPTVNTTERLQSNKPQKTKSATSFHLPPTKEQPTIQKSENRSTTNNKSKRTLEEKLTSAKSQKKRQYFISEETMKAVQLYANGETLKQFKIEIKPQKKKR